MFSYRYWFRGSRLAGPARPNSSPPRHVRLLLEQLEDRLAPALSGPPVSLSIAPLNPTVAVGATLQFQATEFDSMGDSQDVTSQVSWSTIPLTGQGIIGTVSNGTTPGLFTGVSAGTVSVKAQDTQTLIALLQASTTITVAPAAASKLVFTTTAQTLTAGVTSGTMTVTLEDAFNNVVTASSTQTLSLATGSGAGQFRDNATGNTQITSVTILAGSSSASFKYHDTLAGTPTLTVTDNDLPNPPPTQTETVNAAAAAQLVFTTAPQTLTAGVTSGTMTVTLEDAFNNVVTASSTQTLSLTTGSGAGQFRDNATGNTQITSVTILAGSSSASFKYHDTLAGTPTLTVTDNALTNPTTTQTETVNAAVGVQVTATTIVPIFERKLNKKGKPIGKPILVGFQVTVTPAAGALTPGTVDPNTEVKLLQSHVHKVAHKTVIVSVPVPARVTAVTFGPNGTETFTLTVSRHVASPQPISAVFSGDAQFAGSVSAPYRSH
jgi:hypothetical protein